MHFDWNITHWPDELKTFANKQEASLEKIVKTVMPYIQTGMGLAAKLSNELATVASTTHDPFLATVENFLLKEMGNAANVAGFISANSGALVPNLLQNALAFLIAHVHNVTAKTELLNVQTAAQLAYHVNVVSGATAGGTATPAAIGVK